MTKSTFLLILLEPQLIVCTEFYVDITFDQLLLCCYDVRLITFNTESVMHVIVVYNRFFKFHEIWDERDLYIFRDKCRDVQNIFKSNYNLTRYLKLRHDGIRWGSLQGEPGTRRKQYLLFFMTKTLQCDWNDDALLHEMFKLRQGIEIHFLPQEYVIIYEMVDILSERKKQRSSKKEKNNFFVCQIQITFL